MLHRPHQPHRTQWLGYKAKQGYVICRIRVHRGSRKCLVPRGATMASLSIMVLSSQSLHKTCLSPKNELGTTVELWEFWILTGLVKIPRTNSLRLSSLIHSIKPSEEILTPSGSPSRSTSTGKCVGWHLQAARVVALERVTSSTTLLVVLAVQPGEGAIPSSCTVTANSSNVCKIHA